MKTISNCAAVVALIAGLGLLGSVARADDDAKRDEQPKRQRIRIVDRVAARHWIGVHAVPIDDAIKSQLNLEDRLIVRAVMPDSPAAKGGLKQHDILLKFGDRDLKNLEDLLNAVSANEEKTLKVVVLRGGKEVTLDIQPTERPANVEDALQEFDAVWEPLEAWLRVPRGGSLRIVGPGVIEEYAALPGNLSITVTKHNDEPFKITVKRDDDTWETTENEIDELPEELREHVRQQLHGQRGINRLQLRSELNEDGTILVVPRSLPPEGADGAFREQMEKAIQQLEKAFQQLEQIQRRLSEDEPFKALQEEMKSLRQEVERLRDRDQPTDPPATDARET